MTTEQLNAIKAKVYEMCLETMTEEELHDFQITGASHLFEIQEGTSVKRVYLTKKTQLNRSPLRSSASPTTPVPL